MATLRIADVSCAVSASACATLCCSDSLRRGTVAEDADLYAVLVELADLAIDGLAEEPHQRRHLAARPLPVLGAERVEREDVHARLVARLHDRTDRADTGAVARRRAADGAAAPTDRCRP